MVRIYLLEFFFNQNLDFVLGNNDEWNETPPRPIIQMFRALNPYEVFWSLYFRKEGGDEPEQPEVEVFKKGKNGKIKKVKKAKKAKKVKETKGKCSWRNPVGYLCTTNLKPG